jgi:hypothetical protein
MTETRFYQVPEGTDGYGENILKYSDLAGVETVVCNKIANSPRYIAKFWGDQQTLDNISSKPDVTELSGAQESTDKLINNGATVHDNFDAAVDWGWGGAS